MLLVSLSVVAMLWASSLFEINMVALCLSYSIQTMGFTQLAIRIETTVRESMVSVERVLD